MSRLCAPPGVQLRVMRLVREAGILDRAESNSTSNTGSAFQMHLQQRQLGGGHAVQARRLGCVFSVPLYPAVPPGGSPF